MEYLNVVTDGLYVDCTVGGGGHSRAILENGGRVVGIDRDKDAIAYALKYCKDFTDRFKTEISKFSNIISVVSKYTDLVDGVLMDLGVSSKMIDDPSRGFSYRSDGPLLMSMGGGVQTAFDVVNHEDTQELARIFRDYGEERKAGKIARAVVEARSSQPIRTTVQLADIIELAVGPRMPQKSKARVFQALRIHVNNELGELKDGLNGALGVLRPGGRLCVITYHSIEDRAVKYFMKNHADPCECPPGFPECTCGLKPDLKLVTRKAIKPTVREIESNPRSRSALLRVAEKVVVP
ncbi:MAG: 16S rRNA (cytosine(1402)-N(4))-methyltransferase RsmH [Candidatus Latescibacteria bacterium]|nr:16S rRNA (cytosine(1402)-N(4))-methyltransferase RsmH [Candidatus Latescibacterota bacterium]